EPRGDRGDRGPRRDRDDRPRRDNRGDRDDRPRRDSTMAPAEAGNAEGAQVASAPQDMQTADEPLKQPE
ncbi:MAG TPA: hypothetical protein VK439_06000, partial [Rubrivivax sp.]|nr:hypothetical protein [Rubrivivax sp.]